MTQLDPETQRALTCHSFAGSLAYGRLALALVFALNALIYFVGAGQPGIAGMFLAVLATGLAYGSQALFTCGANKHGIGLMAGSVITAIASGVSAVLA